MSVLDMSGRVVVEVGAEAPAGSSFEAFFRATYPRLAAAMLLVTGNAGEAEDIAQETMARVCERWDRVRAMTSPEGYAFRTAFNLNRKRLRWLAVRQRVGISDPSPTGVETLEGAELRSDVLRALAALPHAQREAVVLVGWLGMDSNEAARTLGIGAVSVRGRVNRARAELRRQLGDQVGGSDG